MVKARGEQLIESSGLPRNDLAVHIKVMPIQSKVRNLDLYEL
jgi:hypothetical protein